jgi:hypothetical protein
MMKQVVPKYLAKSLPKSLGFLGSISFLGVVAVLAGCPIYSDNHAHRVCVGGTSCYDCPDNYYTADCVTWQCNSSFDCPGGYACSNYTCVSGGDAGSTYPPGMQSCSAPSDCPSGQNCGADGLCHASDCSTSGCPNGYVCELQTGTLQCVARSNTLPDGGTFSGCTNDTSCATQLGNGAKCLNGACVAPANQCTDATQCAAAEQCVQGVCTPSCDASHPCPTGYSCDTGKGVCTGNPTPCGTSGPTCSAGTTCVEQHCVTPCAAGGTCGGGLVCVDGGCIPNQQPNFVCNADGAQDACTAGSICLHHSCYIACSADAGANTCLGADRYNVCKQVTTSSGTHSVCGSSTNLGSDCDPTVGKNCSAGAICIDGYCR